MKSYYTSLPVYTNYSSLVKLTQTEFRRCKTLLNSPTSQTIISESNFARFRSTSNQYFRVIVCSLNERRERKERKKRSSFDLRDESFSNFHVYNTKRETRRSSNHSHVTSSSTSLSSLETSSFPWCAFTGVKLKRESRALQRYLVIGFTRGVP